MLPQFISMEGNSAHEVIVLDDSDDDDNYEADDADDSSSDEASEPASSGTDEERFLPPVGPAVGDEDEESSLDGDGDSVMAGITGA